jgi:TRAP-type C4-dicarboxylate transport system substrate-binding protein
MVVTTDLWDQLLPASRKCLRLAAEEAGESIKARGRQENEEAVEAMRNKHGLQVHPVPPTLEAEWRETAQVFWPLIRGSLVPAEIFDEVERLLVEYRSSEPSQ